MNLQDVVDDLARTINRSTIINDLAYRPIAASAQGQEIDGLAATSLLQRTTPPEYRAYFDKIRLRQTRQPMTVTLAPFGDRERLAVPIRDETGPLGFLWLITGGLPAFTASDYSAIDAAVSMARTVLSVDPSTHTSRTRTAVMGRLLSPDEEVRRAAFADAMEQRWLDRTAVTTVFAVELESRERVQRGGIEAVAFARHFTGANLPSIAYIGERAGLLYFAARGAQNADVHGALRSEAARRSLTVRAIGSANRDRRADDLLAAADHAATAASIVATLPEFAGAADITQLGGWVMLASIVADRAQLAIFSPAAYALCVDGDAIQRETVETYLDVCGHVREACDLLHIHRTTLYYRLDNMPDVVKKALDDGMQRSTLHLCLKLIRHWESTGRF